MTVDKAIAGDKDFIVMLETQVMIDATAHLLLKKGIDQASIDIIVSKFKEYDADNGGDPAQWAKNNLPTSVEDDFYSVFVSYKISKLVGEESELKEIAAPEFKEWKKIIENNFIRIRHKYIGNGDNISLLNGQEHIDLIELGYSELPDSGILPLAANIKEIPQNSTTVHTKAV